MAEAPAIQRIDQRLSHDERVGFALLALEAWRSGNKPGGRSMIRQLPPDAQQQLVVAVLVNDSDLMSAWEKLPKRTRGKIKSRRPIEMLRVWIDPIREQYLKLISDRLIRGVAQVGEGSPFDVVQRSLEKVATMLEVEIDRTGGDVNKLDKENRRFLVDVMDRVHRMAQVMPRIELLKAQRQKLEAEIRPLLQQGLANGASRPEVDDLVGKVFDVLDQELGLARPEKGAA